jgi:acyl-coenzyme A synthetase/AMP-(fatty) acid ligase/acyl carrier protein
VWSTLDRVTSDSVTIGKPIGNTQAYVLDAANAWVPRGSVGELWLGGSGVTHGYLGREDLTRERFVPNPFTRRGTMYRTGDLVRLRADGRIEYVGRNDFQVKVRGYRIELGEVQFALARVANIAQCAVAVREKTPGDAHLAAYYSTRDRSRLDGAEIREALRATLPEYMIPGWFVQLEQLPLTDNGKVNVKALPNPFNAANLERANAFEQVEKLLAGHPAVRSVALVLPADAPADMRPIACVVPRDGAEPCMIALRKHLRGRIPEPLIPEIVYPVEALPMTRRREVDRERLLKMVPGALRRVRSGAGAPATPMQVTLAKAWRDILGVADIEIHDNFFDLGGHSLSSVQMIARIERETGRALSPRLLVTETLEQIARRLDDSALPMGAAS